MYFVICGINLKGDDATIYFSLSIIIFSFRFVIYLKPFIIPKFGLDGVASLPLAGFYQSFVILRLLLVIITCN